MVYRDAGVSGSRLQLPSIVLAGCCVAGLLAVSGCSDDASTGNDNVDNANGNNNNQDPSCHYDCFGHLDCFNGQVIEYDHTPVPCEYWNGACPSHVLRTCAQGCLYEGQSVFFDNSWDSSTEDASFLCREGVNASVGDPCSSDYQCLQQQATITADGTVINLYLTCDRDTSSCVEAEPPVFPDYLTSCGQVPTLDASEVRIVQGSECWPCLAFHDPAAGCVRQGCTYACYGDHECPRGSICVDLQQGGHAICKPGPPDIYDGLSCDDGPP